MKRYAVLLALALFLLMPTTVAAAECQFILGFKTLRGLIGHDVVGECLENEHHGENGDSLQQTTGGLLVWRKADNWTAFTDGYRSWINGPNGLVQRLNTERFEWEADYAPGGGVATPTPTPVPTPSPESLIQVEQAIAALPLVQRDPGAAGGFWRLARASQPVFWTLLEQVGSAEFYAPEELAAIAEVDEATALQIANMPFMGTPNQGADNRLLSIAMDLATSDLAGLQQILTDPRLSGGITDDSIMTFVFLALGLDQPDTAAAIQALPWVQDGIGRLEFENHFHRDEHSTDWEQRSVFFLIELAKWSQQALMAVLDLPWMHDGITLSEHDVLQDLQDLPRTDAGLTTQLIAMPFLATISRGDEEIIRVLREVSSRNPSAARQVIRHPAFVGGITDDHVALVNLAALEVLSPSVGDQLSAFAWVQDGISHLEKNALNALQELAIHNLEILNFLAQKPWLQDGITFDEMFLLYRFGGIPQEDALRIVNMPFLTSLHDTDFAAFTSLVLMTGHLGSGSLKEVLDHPTLRGGITNETAGLVALLHNVSEHRPDLISVLLDPEQTIRERRTIMLPRGGETKLEVIRFKPGSSHTMDLLEHTVRFHEEFILEAFPKRFLAALVFEDILGEAHQRGAISIRHDDDYGLIAHEVAHSYWVAFPLWIAEGGATFMERVAVRAREGIPIRTYTQGDCPIADTLLAYEEYEIPPGEEFNRGCAYSLGGGMFVDLYFALGDWEFRQGFRRLYVAIRDGTYADECNNRPTSGICYVGAAFVKYAPPEAAAIAGPIIHRWYYGSG